MITSIDRTAFNEYLPRSIQKFFCENTDLNFRGEAFNDIYKSVIGWTDIDIRETFDTPKKGILVVESFGTETEEDNVCADLYFELQGTLTTTLAIDANRLDRTIEVVDPTNITNVSLLKIGGDFVAVLGKDKTTLNPNVFNVQQLFSDYPAGTLVEIIDMKEQARACEICGTLTLRIVTDVDTKSPRRYGKRDILDMQGHLAKILKQTDFIPLYDFGLDAPTDIEFRYNYWTPEYTELPMGHDDYKEGLFTIPYWVDLYYAPDTYDIITNHKTVMKKVTRA